MKLYKDKNCKEEIIELNLGIVEAGESKEFIFYVKNDIEANLKELSFLINHKEVKIIKSPTNMEIGEIAELIIKWSPSVTLKEGLKTLIEIKGKELWG